jgi:hypothetical protein
VSVQDREVSGDHGSPASSTAASAVELEQRGHLIRLGILNNLGTAVTLLTGLVMVPFMLEGLGSAEYGAWIMIISLSGLVMSVDLGLALVVTREVARTGLGACPGREPGCPDEPVELLDSGWIGVRADLDRDDPALAADPEQALAGAFARTDTGNDEVVVFLRRGRGLARAAFDADLESSGRVTTAAGEVVAPRDGQAEEIDAGPADLPGEGGRGTLYRVTFVNDARHLGTARFRVVEPLVDDALDFAVRAWDARGAPIAPCGGRDDAAARACRAAVRRVALELTVGRAGGRQQTFRREVALGGSW